MRVKINDSLLHWRVHRLEVHFQAQCGGAVKALNIVADEEAAHCQSFVRRTSDNGEHVDDGQMSQETIGCVIENVAHGVLCAAHNALHPVNRAQVMAPVDALAASPGTSGMFTVDSDYKIQQPLAQLFVAQLINLEWAQPGGGEHQVYSAKSDVEDGAGHELVTAYALKRPDGKWSLLVVNRDQQNAHRARIAFRGDAGTVTGFAGPVEIATFGSDQYKWNPPLTRFMAHAETAAAPTVVAYTNGSADPDGPVVRSQPEGTEETLYNLPASSVVVIRGSIAPH